MIKSGNNYPLQKANDKLVNSLLNLKHIITNHEAKLTKLNASSLTLNCGRGSSINSAGVSNVPHLYASSAPLRFQPSRNKVAQITLNKANTTQQISRLVWGKKFKMKNNAKWRTWAQQINKTKKSCVKSLVCSQDATCFKVKLQPNRYLFAYICPFSCQ